MPTGLQVRQEWCSISISNSEGDPNLYLIFLSVNFEYVPQFENIPKRRKTMQVSDYKGNLKELFLNYSFSKYLLSSYYFQSMR